MKDTMEDDEETRRILTEWVTALAHELGVAEAPVDIDAILGLAGTAAHAVLRPAAPLTTYLLGYAAGRADDSRAAFETAAVGVRRLAAEQGSSPRQ